MAKIQRYQQDQLASSLVGTPGVDTSAQSLAQTQIGLVGQAASSSLQAQRQIVSNSQQQSSYMLGIARNAFQDLQQELAARQRQVAQAAKDQERVQNELEVANKGASLEMELDTLSTQLQSQFRDNPEGIIPAWKEQAQQSLLAFVQKHPMNPAVLADVNRRAVNKIASEHQQYNDWVLTKRNEAIKADLIGNTEQLKALSGNGGDWGAFNKNLARVDGLSNVYRNVYGAAAPVEMQKTREQMSRQYLMSMMDESADLAYNHLQRGDFETLLNADDRKEMTDTARARMHADTVLAAQQEAVVNQNIRNRVTDIFADVDMFAPDATKTSKAIQELNGIIGELQKPQTENVKGLRPAIGGELIRDETTLKNAISVKHEVEQAQRKAVNDKKQHEDLMRIVDDRERRAAEKKLADAKQKEKEDALTRANAATPLKTEALTAFKVATEDQYKKGKDVFTRIRDIDNARHLFDEIHRQKLDVLPGEKDIFYPQHRAKLDAEMKLLQTELDAKGKEKPPFWGFGRTPEQKAQDAITRGAPVEVARVLNPKNDPSKTYSVNMHWSVVMNTGIDKYRSEHGGQYPSDPELAIIMQQMAGVTKDTYTP